MKGGAKVSGCLWGGQPENGGGVVKRLQNGGCSWRVGGSLIFLPTSGVGFNTRFGDEPFRISVFRLPYLVHMIRQPEKAFSIAKSISHQWRVGGSPTFLPTRHVRFNVRFGDEPLSFHFCFSGCLILFTQLGSLKPLQNPSGSLKNKKCRHSRVGENLV